MYEIGFYKRKRCWIYTGKFISCPCEQCVYAAQDHWEIWPAIFLRLQE